MTKILVIGDPHAHPDHSNDRFSCLGNYIVAKKPDTVVCIGDWADMPSLSSYDVGKKSFEGRRYNDDIAAAKEAQELFFRPIWEEQERLIRNHEKRWNPRMVMTLGNHEDRIVRATESDPKLDGVLSLDDLEYEEYGWEVVPFRETITIEGIVFSHYFTSGVMDRPISGENAARLTLTKKHQSCTSGHSHLFDFSVGNRGDGSRICGNIAGCFFEHNMSYVSEQGNRTAWRGVCMYHEVKDGEYDLMQVSLQYLKENYA